MPKIVQGFRGTVKLSYEGDSFYFRVSNIDIALKQDAQSFLPVYGGSDLKRIWHMGTGDVSINVNLPIVEDLFGKLYPLAVDCTEFDIEITYYGQEGRKATGCIIDSFSLTCDAGEVANLNISMVAKSVEVFTDTFGRSYTKGEKLLTWDKCGITFIGEELYLNNYIQSFSYNIINGIKAIKTAEGLLPSILTRAIQDVSGQIQFYDIAFPHRGTKEYELGFNDLVFNINNTSIQHNVVFNPTENVPLVPGPVLSVVTWSKSDDF
jgi:hypothetical protein